MKAEHRIKRIRELLKRLDEGADVAQRDLKIAVGTEEYEFLKASWQDEKARRADFADKPAELKEYEALLKRALFLNNRQEALSNKRKPSAHKMWYQAEAAFERALEHLQESLSVNPGLSIWLDREVSFEAGYESGPNAIDIPRIITSRSADRLEGDRLKRSIRDVKREALQNALDKLEAKITNAEPNADKAALRMKQLNRLLNKVK